MIVDEGQGNVPCPLETLEGGRTDPRLLLRPPDLTPEGDRVYVDKN